MTTLRIQLIIISGILIVLALAFSLVIASRVSRPLRRITAAAKEMAAGNYEKNFDGGGCSEINELAVTLNYAASEIGRSEKLQHDIIANITHDLRTPLTMIGGYAEYMRDFPDEDHSESLNVIIDETKRLGQLVNDVLDLSRLSAGAQNLNVALFDLSDMLHTFVNHYNSLIAPDGYQIRLNAPDFVPVEADEQRM